MTERHKNPKCPSVDEWISKCGGISYKGILFGHKEE